MPLVQSQFMWKQIFAGIAAGLNARCFLRCSCFCVVRMGPRKSRDLRRRVPAPRGHWRWRSELSLQWELCLVWTGSRASLLPTRLIRETTYRDS